MLFSVDANTVALAFIAVLNVITAILAYKTHRQAKLTEKNTNSMKDALVAATKKASFAEGREDMRSETKADEKAEAKGTKK